MQDLVRPGEDPVRQFDPKQFSVRAAIGFLATLMLASSVAAEELQDPGPLDPRILEAVFVVESGSTRPLRPARSSDPSPAISTPSPPLGTG